MKFKIGDRVKVMRIVTGEIDKWKYLIGMVGKIMRIEENQNDSYLVQFEEQLKCVGYGNDVFLNEKEIEHYGEYQTKIE